MKKSVAMLLTLALLTALYGGAFADTLTLPSMTTVIEEEAFSDNPALDEVVIPWGAEAIESRAFAYSGVKIIHIPGTVTRIADDAFEGASVTIRAAADSYAKQYADAHGIPWEDAGNWERQQVAEAMEDLRTLEAAGNAGHLEMLELLEEEAYDDEATRAFVREYNALALEANDAAEVYNESVVAMADAVEGFEDMMADASFSEGRGGSAFVLGGLGLVADEDLDVSGDLGIESAELLEDGAIRIQTAGGTLYLTMDASTLFLSRSRRATRSQSNGLAEANLSWNDVLDKCGRFYDLATNWIGSVGLEVDLAIERAQSAFDYDRDLMLTVRAVNDKHHMGPVHLNKKDQARIRERVARMNKAKAQKALFLSVKGILSKIDVAGASANLLVLRKHVGELDEIAAHGHPNERDTSVSSKDTAAKLNRDMANLRKLYLADAVSSVVGIAAGISSVTTALCSMMTAVAPPLAAALASATVILRIARVLNGLIGTYFFAYREDELYGAVMKAHARLHTYVYGWVKERGSGRPIGGVKVTDGVTTAATDDNGYYELYLSPEPTSLVYTREGYTTGGLVATPAEGEGTRMDDVYLDNDEIPIDAEHFPDAVMRKHVKDSWDKDQNGKLSAYERTCWPSFAVSELYGTGGIGSLKGLEYFSSIRDLMLNNCTFERFDVDLNTFTNLSNLGFNECPNLTRVELRDQPALKNVSYHNCPSLAEVCLTGALEVTEISCHGNPALTKLDLSGCPRLQQCFISESEGLTGILDLSHCLELRYVSVDNTNLSAVLVSRSAPFYNPDWEKADYRGVFRGV